MNILITGGTGFIGSHLIKYLIQDNHHIIVLTRRSVNTSPQPVHFVRTLQDIDPGKSIDVIINLAGAPIDKRWSDAYKQTLIDSRIDTTNAIINWISRARTLPTTLISASAIGYYGSQGATPLDEDTNCHDEFTHRLCKQWESTALTAQALSVRTVITRFGIVLGKQGGALKRMLPAFRLGLGGQLGDGKQMMSWVHIDDVCRALLFFIQHPELSGAFNLTAPQAVTNAEFTHVLGKQLRRLTCFNLPAWVVKLLFAEMGETLLLKGQQVIPKRLTDAGFTFTYSTLAVALSHLLN